MERGSPSSFLFYGLPFSDLLELSQDRLFGFFFFKKFVDAYDENSPNSVYLVDCESF